jgi:FMN-dependent NADH-azoreductase
MKLLEIQSSVRTYGSISRALSREFVQALQATHAATQHRLRDVGLTPPPHPTERWAIANYTLPESRTPEMVQILAHSEALIEELLWADSLLLGVPMYNLGVPSTLKAYLDNVVRVGRTFTVADRETLMLQGLATGKKALLVSPSASSYPSGTAAEKQDFCIPYMRAVLALIGITDVTVVKVPNQFMPTEIRQQAIDAAQAKLVALAATW